MEAMIVQTSPDRSLSSNYKQQTRNQKKITRNFISKSSENLAPSANHIHGGLLFGPPPSLSLSYPLYHNLQNQKPPLLPLPVHRPHNSLLARKPNRTRLRSDQSITPKKSKPEMKKEDTRNQNSTHTEPEKPLGPDPIDLPVDVSSILSISPDPSSLPLPKFFVNRKLSSCKEEAAGIDAGATDNLRRLLRLR